MTDAYVEQPEQATTAQVEQRIVDAVRDIRTYWDELLEIPEGGSTGSPSTDTLTALERRLTLRQDVDRLLVQTCRLVIRDRPLRTVRLERSADTLDMLALLERHARWLSGHEDAERIARRLARRARDVELTARPPARDHVLLGDCPFLLSVEVDLDEPVPAGWPAQLAGWPHTSVEPCWGRVQAKIGGDGYATCNGCGQTALIEWWEDVLGLNLQPVTLPSLVPILHARLGLRITDRTLRNWRRAGLIVPVLRAEDHEPHGGIGPTLVWDLFDPREVIARAADMGRACALCGKPWQGGGDVCRACWVLTQHAQPGRAVEDDLPNIAGVPVTTQPRRPVARHVPMPSRGDEALCERSWLPPAQCACGRHG